MLQCFGIEEASVVLLSDEYTWAGVNDPEQTNDDDLKRDDNW